MLSTEIGSDPSMKKIIIIMIAVLVLLGSAGGVYFYVNSNSVDPSKSLGSSYWGDACGLSPTGFVVCTNEFGVRFDSCSTGLGRYRLKVSVTEPRYQPVSLEMWTESPTTYKRLESGEIYSEGADACYHEGYRFGSQDITINRGSSCSQISGPEDKFTLMFYVSDGAGLPSPCRFSNEKSPEPDEK